MSEQAVSVFNDWLSKRGLRASVANITSKTENKIEVFVETNFHLFTETTLRDVVQTALQYRDKNVAKGT